VLEQTLPELQRLGIDQQVFTSKALEDEKESLLSGIRVRRFDYSYCQWPLPSERKRKYDLCGGNLLSHPLEAALEAAPRLSVIHCHTGNRLAGQCLRVAEIRNVPSIVTLHGGHFAVPQQELKQKSGAAENSSLSLNWGKIWSAYYRTRDVLKRASAVICVGTDEYDAARSALPGQTIHLLPGGVDVHAFENGDSQKGSNLLGLPLGTNYIVSIARLDAQKDQLTLVKALRSLPDPPFLALVGPETTPGYADELVQAAQGTPLAKKLLIAGAFSPAAIPDLLAGATISVLPSVHEPFGLSVVEAWAARTPLIASNVGGPAALLKGEADGLLFESGNADELKRKIEFLIAHPEKREQLQESGRKRAMQYTWEKRARKLMAIYAQAGAYFEEKDAA
jgi:glycosyltransferase involved in cell wall biosynthesis